VSGHRRFFIAPGQIDGDRAVITGDAVRQIKRVLRLKEGDSISLLDASGAEFEARIASLSAGSITAEILGSRRCAAEPRIRLSLAVCLPKGDKIELIVQKCTELGISELVVASSERSVPRVDSPKAAERLGRWRRIATEAAEQCGRGRVPEIGGIVEFADLADLIRESPLALLAWEGDGGAPLRDVLRTHAGAGSVMLIIGPEGGLTEDEAHVATDAGAVLVSLGRRILRCETAAIAACAAVMYELD
jgi:16S rRNA (uracil1498-N3)-methyltransferase